MDEGDLNEYLGVLVDKFDDGTIKLSQPHLIKQIVLDDLWFNDRTKPKPTLAPGRRAGFGEGAGCKSHER